MSPRLPAAPGRRGSQSVLASEDDCGEGGEAEERVPSRRSQACRDPPTSLLCDFRPVACPLWASDSSSVDGR